jgi:hypothetical protein
MAHWSAMLCGLLAAMTLALTPVLPAQEAGSQPQEKPAGELQKQRTKPPAATKEAIPGCTDVVLL